MFESIKIKPLTKEQIIISADRLTRFKFTEQKYLRVFTDILVNNLISPKMKKTEIEETDYKKITELAEYIINSSLENLGISIQNSGKINEKLKQYENLVFVLESSCEKLLDNNINYDGILEVLGKPDVKNLQWLKSLASDSDPVTLRELHALKFPISTVLICEGITEETLLPEFAKLMDFDFDKNGIFVLSAGGKNQVVKTFYKLVECLKLPIFVLLDKDAEENYREILPKMRKIDRIHLIEHGEFEDILPVKLLEKTLAFATKNISVAEEGEIHEGETVEFLTDFFKHRGLHEFKKAEFAHMVKENISSKEDVSEEISEILKELFTIIN